MTRNTTRRVEVAIPVRDADQRSHLEQMFADQLRDTAKGRFQQPDGTYVLAQGEPFNAQEHFCDQAYAGDWAWAKPRKEESPRPAARPAQKPAEKAPPAPQKQIKKTPQVHKTRRGLLGRLIQRD